MGRKKTYKNFFDFSQDVFPQEKLLIDPFLSRYYRPFSLRLSWLLYKTKITPNFITFLQIIISLSACLSISMLPDQNIFIMVVIFLHFAYLLDCCDGEIARAKKMSSLEGLFLDKFAHAITMPSIFMAVSLYYCKYFVDHQFFILLISFLSSLCTFNPINRLVTSIVSKLITEKKYNQYDIDKYNKKRKFKDDNAGFQSPRVKNFVIPIKANLRVSLGKKIFQFAKQFFRHVSYLFFITFLLILELLGVPIYILFSFWLFLLLSVITKEMYFLYLVIFKKIILDRYFLLLSKIEVDL